MTYSEEYEHTLDQELEQKEVKLGFALEKNNQLEESLRELKSKYIKSEAEVAALQQLQENLESELQKYRAQTTDLELLNDHWEQSTRALHFSTQELEERLNQVQEDAVLYQVELDEVCTQQESQVQELRQQYTHLLQKFHSLKTQPRVHTLVCSDTLIDPYHTNFRDEHELFRKIQDSVQVLNQAGNVCVLVYGKAKNCQFKKLVKRSLEYIGQTVACDQVSLSFIGVGGAGIWDCVQSSRPSTVWRELLEKSKLKLDRNWLSAASRYIEEFEKPKNGHCVITLELRIGNRLTQASFVDLIDTDGISEEGTAQEAVSILKDLWWVQDSLSVLKSSAIAQVPGKSWLPLLLQQALMHSQVKLIVFPASSEDYETLQFGAGVRVTEATLPKTTSNSEVKRTCTLLHKERIEKQKLLMKVNRLEETSAVLHKLSTVKKDTFRSMQHTRLDRERAARIQLQALQQELLAMKRSYEAANKKLRRLKGSSVTEIQARRAVNRQLDFKEKQVKRVLSFSPQRPPSVLPGSVQLQGGISSPTRIPTVRFGCIFTL